MNEARYYNDQGKVLCQVCMKPFQVISATHLKKHGMNIDKYKETYPDAPLSSKSFMAKNKYKDSDIFKDDEDAFGRKRTEEPTKTDFGDDVQNTPNVDMIRQLAKAAETEDVEPEDDGSNLPPILKNKVDIKSFLKKVYTNIAENYFIEKLDNNGGLLYCYITDLVDLKTRTIFDFPNTFWHNRDARQDGLRNQKLIADGWTIKTITEKYPTVSDVQAHMDLVIDG